MTLQRTNLPVKTQQPEAAVTFDQPRRKGSTHCVVVWMWVWVGACGPEAKLDDGRAPSLIAVASSICRRSSSSEDARVYCAGDTDASSYDGSLLGLSTRRLSSSSSSLPLVLSRPQVAAVPGAAVMRFTDSTTRRLSSASVLDVLAPACPSCTGVGWRDAACARKRFRSDKGRCDKAARLLERGVACLGGSLGVCTATRWPK